MAEIFNKYTIDIANLSEGRIKQFFSIDNLFFNHFKFLAKYKGKGQVDAYVEKQDENILLNLHTKINLLTKCDRCLDNMSYKLNTSSTTIFTYDFSNIQQRDLVVEYLPPNETKINITNKIYEDIFLSIPISFLHDKTGDNTCNSTMIDLLNDYSSPNTRIDPRWEKLKSLNIK